MPQYCLCVLFSSPLCACLLMMLLLSALGCLYSAARHPLETMKQACCPNMLPTCFCLPSVAVRTSSHVTWHVVAWKERDFGACSLCNPCSPHTNTDTPNKLYKLIPLCCANMHMQVDTLHCTGMCFAPSYVHCHVYTYLYTPVQFPPIAFNCTPAYSTQMHNVHDNKTQMPKRAWPFVIRAKNGGGAHWSKNDF